MIKPKILNETPVSMAEVKTVLKSNQKKDEELNFRAGKAMEYLDQFVKLKDAEYKSLYKKIEDLNIARLKDAYIIKMLDLLPTSMEEVKSILQGYPVSLTQADMKKIADTIADNLPKKK